MKTLTIKLAAPLQSYGMEASFNERTTQLYPSKSAVLGMIGAALGYRRNDNRLKKLNDLSYAVRVDQPGLVMTDFQNVEYAPNKRKVTHRQYLQDALFMVAIGSEDEALIEEIKYALRHPIFQIYLGRRSNPVAGVIKTEIVDQSNPVQVLKESTWQAKKWYKIRKSSQKKVSVSIYADAFLLENGEVTMARDLIGSFNQKNRYHQYRGLRKLNVQVENDKYKDQDKEESIWWDAIEGEN